VREGEYTTRNGTVAFSVSAFNDRDRDAEYVPLDLKGDGQNFVYTHPDATVDIAVVPALPDQAVFDFKALPEESLTTQESFSKLQIGEGSEVFFAGLLVQFFGEHRNYPVIRFGRVAMLPDERIRWADDPSKPAELAQLHLLETQTYGGNSGSPVFFYLGSDRTPGSIVLGAPVIMLAGIMKGFFNNPSPIGFVQTPTALIPYSTQNIGIAAITPSFLLHDILFSNELKKFRAEHPISSTPTAH
jgi:hypothetical protein